MPSRRKKYFHFLILILLLSVFLVSSCGYRMRGTQELRGDLQTVAILPFTNQTFESRLENDLFNALVDEFARSKNLKVVAAKDADLLVNGTIIAVESYSISYSPDDKTYEYRVTMSVDVEIVEARSKQVFWRRQAMREVEEYKATNEPFTIDRRKHAALRRVCQVLAENIHDGLFTDF
ncbi:MAG: LptE family protein [Deltaproteobacteria bacterium]|nr:LptE family protein [Deltaproteobacteria bacterium]